MDADEKSLLREVVLGLARIEARVAMGEQSAGDRARELAEVKAILQPAAAYFAAVNEANAESAARAITAKQDAETTRTAWLAWLTPARLQLLLGILGALGLGNADRIVRAVHAFAAAEVQEAPAEPEQAVVSPGEEDTP